MHFLLPLSVFEISLLFTLLIILLLSWYRLYVIEKRFAFVTYRRKVFFLKTLLRFLSVACILIALLAPFKKITKKQFSAGNHYIYILLDLSNSMRAQDTPPGRLDRAKYAISQIIQKTQGNYCIILFSNEAIVYCPLTHDKEAILDLYLPPITFGITSGGGSNIGRAYELAMKKVKENHRQDVKNSIICISDWETSMLPEGSLFREAHAYNLSLYQVVIGSPTGEYIPWKGGVLTKDGEAVLSKAMPQNAVKLCREVNSCATFRIAKELDSTPSLIRNIQENSTIIAGKQHTSGDNIYYYPLLLSILFLVLDILLHLPLISLKP